MGKTTNILIAAIGGFVAGILLAPKSGEETRSELLSKADDAKKLARKKAKEVDAAVRSGSKTAGVGVKEVEKELGEFGASAKTTAEKIAAEAIELGGEARTRASHVADTARATAARVTADAAKHLKEK